MGFRWCRPHSGNAFHRKLWQSNATKWATFVNKASTRRDPAKENNRWDGNRFHWFSLRFDLIGPSRHTNWLVSDAIPSDFGIIWVSLGIYIHQRLQHFDWMLELAATNERTNVCQVSISVIDMPLGVTRSFGHFANAPRLYQLPKMRQQDAHELRTADSQWILLSSRLECLTLESRSTSNWRFSLHRVITLIPFPAQSDLLQMPWRR